MKNKMISVIVPVYNVEKYLNQCIGSIVSQTFTNLEIILVDDGSTDSSGSICEKWMQKDSRIKVLHKKNEGLGYARNSGLEVAHGEYATFIDSDDTISKNMIRNLMDGIRKNNSELCIGGYNRINEEGKLLYKKAYFDKFYEYDDVKNSLLPKLIGALPDKHDSIKMSVWNVLFSMQVIKKNKLRFVSEKDYMSEDIIWDINYLTRINRAQLISFSDYNYRVRNGSLTTQMSYDKERLRKVKELYLYELGLIKQLKISGDAELRLQKVFFINIRSCFIQEIKFNKLPLLYKKIRYLVKDPLVSKISSKYPVKKLQFKQRIFVTLIKKQRSLGLICLLKIMYGD